MGICALHLHQQYLEKVSEFETGDLNNMHQISVDFYDIFFRFPYENKINENKHELISFRSFHMLGKRFIHKSLNQHMNLKILLVFSRFDELENEKK